MLSAVPKVVWTTHEAPTDRASIVMTVPAVTFIDEVALQVAPALFAGVQLAMAAPVLTPVPGVTAQRL